jgi:hypothetical protein
MRWPGFKNDKYLKEMKDPKKLKEYVGRINFKDVDYLSLEPTI